jgi:hypothetical protein
MKNGQFPDEIVKIESTQIRGVCAQTDFITGE